MSKVGYVILAPQRAGSHSERRPKTINVLWIQKVDLLGFLNLSYYGLNMPIDLSLDIRPIVIASQS